MNLAMNLALLLLCTGLSWFDFRTRRIPNAVTLPLLLTGLVLHLPGSAETWLLSTLLFTGWRMGWIGGGDAKLWLGLLWILPAEGGLPLLMAGVWLFTAAGQLAWRRLTRTGIKAALPAAWRTIPFAAWLVLFS